MNELLKRHYLDPCSLIKACKGFFIFSIFFFFVHSVSSHSYFYFSNPEKFINFRAIYPQFYDQSNNGQILMYSDRYIKGGFWVSYHDVLFCNLHGEKEFTIVNFQPHRVYYPKVSDSTKAAWSYNKKFPKEKICFIESTVSAELGFFKSLWPTITKRSLKFRT